MRKLPYGRMLVALMAGWLAAGWFWSAPAVPRAVLPVQSDQLLFSPDSRWLVTAGPWADELMTWNVASGEVHRKLQLPVDYDDGPFSGRSATFSADSKQLAVAGIPKSVLLWSMTEDLGPKVITCEQEQLFPFYGNDLFFEGDRLFRFIFATGQTWDLREKRVVQTFKEAPHVRPMRAGLGYLSENEVQLVNLRTGETLGGCILPKHHSFAAVDATRDHSTLIGNMSAGWGPREPILFDCVAQSYRRMPNGWGATALAISADGDWCAVSATGKHPVNIVKPSKRLIPGQIGKNNAFFNWVANLLDSVFPDRCGPLPASKQNLFILNTIDFSMRDAIPDVTQARISPDIKTLATISEDGRVSLWDFPIPRPVGKTVAVSISVGLAAFVLLTWFKRSTTEPAAAKNTGQ